MLQLDDNVVDIMQMHQPHVTQESRASVFYSRPAWLRQKASAVPPINKYEQGLPGTVMNASGRPNCFILGQVNAQIFGIRIEAKDGGK